MDEVSLAKSLRNLNRSDEPNPEFKESLFAVLQKEYESTGRPMDLLDAPEPDDEAPFEARPRKPESAWRWQWAAVAFVLVGMTGLFTLWLLPGPEDEITPTQESTAPGPNTTTAVPEGRIDIGGNLIRLPEGMHPLEVASDGTQMAFLVSSELQPAGEPPLEESELIVVERSTGDITVRTPLVDGPSGLALDESGVWVTHFDTGSVSLVDRSTGEITADIALELPFDFGNGEDRRLFLPNDIVAGEDTVWVSTARGAVASIDKSTGDVEYLTDFASDVPGAQVQGPSYVGGMALLDGDLWIALELGGVTRLDPTTGGMVNIDLQTLDHTASQVFVVDGAVYIQGNRLERGADGALVLDGSYTASDESAVSLLDGRSVTVQGSAVIDGIVLFVGGVDGEFGALSDDGLFHRLDGTLALQGEPLVTNADTSQRVVQLDGEAWIMDSGGSQVIRVQKTGQIEPDAASMDVRWSISGVGMTDGFFPDNRLLAASGEMVFVADGWGGLNDDPSAVTAFDAATGELIWQRTDLREEATFDSVFIQVLTSDRLIVNGQHRMLGALNPATGESIWTFDIPDAYNAPSGAVVAEGVLYVGIHATGEGAIEPPIVYAINLDDRSVIWETVLTEGTDLQPVAPGLSENTLLLSTTLSHPGSAEGNMVHALSREDGSLLWELNLGGEQQFRFSPTLIQDDIAIVSSPNEMLAVSMDDGSTIWAVPDAQPLAQSDDGRLFGRVHQAIAEFDWETGEAAMFSEVDWNQGVYRPNGIVFVGDQMVVSDGRHLLAYSMSGGELLWTWSAPGIIVDFPVTVGEAIAVPIGDQDAASPEDRRVMVIESP